MSYCKWFIGMAILMALTIIGFVPFADAEEYKCFAELYPDKTTEVNITTLGGTITVNGVKYRVMAEVKHPTQNSWIQWIDSGELDDVCDFAMFFAFNKDGQIGADFHECEKAFEMVLNYCSENDLDINDFLHSAEPLPKVKT